MGSGLCLPKKAVADSQSMIEELKKRNRVIEETIRKDKDEEKRNIKILLLGSADSGKSTIVKQMRILHTSGFNESDLITYRFTVFSNLFTSYHHIANGVYQLFITIPLEEAGLIETFSTNYHYFMELDEDEQKAILTKLANYKCVAEVWKRKTEISLPDNTVYFLSNMDRILDPNYMPNTQDIIHVRAPTTGVYEILFTLEKYQIRLIDVGGQKSERRKWIYCFENVHAVLFIIGLSCYDQCMTEDAKENAMEDSIDLFHKMFKNQCFSRSTFILFLNKKDLFEEKLNYSQLSKYFPKYKGVNDVNSASEFIKNMCLKVLEDNPKPIYPHFTNAVDTQNIDHVFRTVYDIIVKNNLSRTGMTL